MSLNPRFSRYLEHFGETVPTRDFAAAPDKRQLTALRHDIDYNLDVALELAYWEYKAGLRATYFVLHTTDYYRNDGALIEKCLQLQDFGHEVGLHTNFLAAWLRQEIDDPGAALEGELDRLRSGGIDLSGVTAHGDALCYEAGFTNYWMFEELRPDNPSQDENRVTAEGTPARDVDRAISYPEDSHELVRPDGKRFAYWSMKLSSFGLDYEASRLSPDSYFSDSGGVWKRTPDPLTHTFGKDRSLVLMHPIYWKGDQRHYYFLSTARSGSKWLANFLDKATPVAARHEFTLNHEFEDGTPEAHKRTAAGFTDLVSDKAEAGRLINDARSWSEGLQTDYAEANVYLEQFLDLLPRGPDTELIHLFRDPQDVVRSLLQRGWYSVPHDDRHSRIDVEGWDSMSQLEQVCWYVRDVNARLRQACSAQLRFEDMVGDPAHLKSWLEERGIPVFPRLAEGVFTKSVNATPQWEVDRFEAWPAEDKETFDRICAPERAALGYGPADHVQPNEDAPSSRQDASDASIKQSGNPIQTLFDPSMFKTPGGVRTIRCIQSWNAGAAQLTFFPAVRGYLLLGGGYWSPKKEVPPQLQGRMGEVSVSPLTFFCGWLLEDDCVYVLDIEVEFGEKPISLRVMCLSYDEQGELIARQDIGALSREWPTFTRYFRPRRGAATFNIALFKGHDEAGAPIVVRRCKLVRCIEDRARLGAPEEVAASAPVASPVADAHSAVTSFGRSVSIGANNLSPRISIFNFRKTPGNKHQNPSALGAAPSASGSLSAIVAKIFYKLRFEIWKIRRIKTRIDVVPGATVWGSISVDKLSEGTAYDLVGVPILAGGQPAEKGGFRLGTFLPDQRTVGFRLPEFGDAEAFDIQLVRPMGANDAVDLSAEVWILDSRKRERDL